MRSCMRTLTADIVALCGSTNTLILQRAGSAAGATMILVLTPVAIALRSQAKRAATTMKNDEKTAQAAPERKQSQGQARA
mmetsp:Transcript_80753/g.160034  ORF Transcript_80753/g.160034 Transcript_80753/m.160034 type:complete len:80 (-) Transcript_80753:18-257(-)